MKQEIEQYFINFKYKITAAGKNKECGGSGADSQTSSELNKS